MRRIGIYKTDIESYPDCFRPGIKYPEYYFDELSVSPNDIYDSVRNCFRLMELDIVHYGTNEWNPLGQYINPGNYVLIKPNLVMDKNFYPDGGTDCLYTNPSVIAAVIDYIVIAMAGKGKIVVGDAPMQECNFNNIRDKHRFAEMVEFYKNKGINIELIDFRELTSEVSHGIYYSKINKNSKGKIINLGKESAFYKLEEFESKKLRVTNYDPRILPSHHIGEKQEYYISQYILDADVIINMPKPKTHRKAGITAALKNLVGINVRKEFLPHHTIGSLTEGGDEYPHHNFIRNIQARLIDLQNIQRAEGKYLISLIPHYLSMGIWVGLRALGNKYEEGSWYGNHTISRTICDLNKILFYADKEGTMQSTKQRKMFIIADMIISGEKEGPVSPTPKQVGIIAMGENPVEFDKIIATIMGFDVKKIPTFGAVDNYNGRYRFIEDEEMSVISNDAAFNDMDIQEYYYEDSLKFIPSEGWIGHIEKND